MSLHDYRASRELEAADIPFYGLVMAAMRRADTFNLSKLKLAFPEVWEELCKRYDAPASGLLPGERDPAIGYGRRADGTVYDLPKEESA